MQYLKLTLLVLFTLMSAFSWLLTKTLSIVLFKLSELCMFAGGWCLETSADVYDELEEGVENVRDWERDLKEGDE